VVIDQRAELIARNAVRSMPWRKKRWSPVWRATSRPGIVVTPRVMAAETRTATQ